MAQKIFIGIDGGGTHSTAVAAYPDGSIAACVDGGGLNFHNVGVDLVRDRLLEMTDALRAKSGCEIDQVCVGMSALDAPADAQTLACFEKDAYRPGQLDLQSDAYIALMGLTQGQPGVIVICGTGSMLLMLDGKGNQIPAGGWGYLLNDAGSGYTLARNGLLFAIEYAEGLSEATPLLQDAMDYFHVDTPRGLIDRVYAPNFTPDRLAGFARCVIARAQEGNVSAQELLSDNMKRLARHAAHLISEAPEASRVGLYGGIFAHSEAARCLFTRELKALAPQATVQPPDYPPELGALIHLFQKKGILTDDVLARMKSTYEEYRHDSH
ncbi:MAG: hypothetical protein IKW00_03905 [Clostridia bacterium]|nr:hypothetical protein [Clostridia bacterium]